MRFYGSRGAIPGPLGALSYIRKLLAMKTAYMFALICSVGLLASAAGFADSQAGMSAVETARLKFDAFNKHDASAIQALYATDAILHSPDHSNLVGNSQIADTYRWLFDAIPDAQDNLQSLGNSGNKVYAQFVLTGHLKGAQGKAVNLRIMSVYTVEGGHIVDDSTYYDRMAQ